MLIVFFGGLGQFVQLLTTTVDVRNAAMQRWANQDQGRLEQVDEFTRECLIGVPVEINDEISAPISISACAHANGFDDLLVVVHNADKTIKSYAWPLSLIGSKDWFKGRGGIAQN